MLYQRKSHIGIRDYAPYGCKWEGKEVVICPLPMRQKIHNAMGKHADKKGECRSIQQERQGEESLRYATPSGAGEYGVPQPW
jgi:hypothetical protein